MPRSKSSFNPIESKVGTTLTYITEQVLVLALAHHHIRLVQFQGLTFSDVSKASLLSVEWSNDMEVWNKERRGRKGPMPKNLRDRGLLIWSTASGGMWNVMEYKFLSFQFGSPAFLPSFLSNQYNEHTISYTLLPSYDIPFPRWLLVLCTLNNIMSYPLVILVNFLTSLQASLTICLPHQTPIVNLYKHNIGSILYHSCDKCTSWTTSLKYAHLMLFRFLSRKIAFGQWRFDQYAHGWI
jgi:hypothetical protein